MSAVERVLTEVEAMAPDLVEQAAALVGIPSIGGSDAENDAQAHLASLFAVGGLDVDHWRLDLDALTADPEFPGMEVERREAWGLVARHPGSGDGPTLMLNGHVDVVPIGDPAAWSAAPFDPQIVDGSIVGRGTCDMKAGVVAAWGAVEAIRRAGVGLRGDVLLATVQGEEDGGLGTFATLRRGWRADACVIAEPTSLDLVPANSGALTFRLIVRGRATHASRRTEGVSAIEKFWPVWTALAGLERRRHSTVPSMAAKWPLAHPLSLGTIHAGDWASSVPDLLVAEGRLGVALGEPVDIAKAALEAAVAEASDADPWLRDHPVEVQWWGGQFESGQLPGESDLVERVSAAHRLAVTDRPGEVWAAPYGSDLRLLTNIGHIPTLQYGPGDAALAHGPDESVPIAELVACTRTLAVLALDICGTT
jgi:acetylornithine deacetylase